VLPKRTHWFPAADPEGSRESGPASRTSRSESAPLDPREAAAVEQEEILEKVVEPFESEARNPFWASQMERAIESQFGALSAEVSDGVAIRDVECRQSRCRVRLLFRDQGLADRFQRHLIGEEVFSLVGCRLRSIGFETVFEGVSQTLFLLWQGRSAS